MLTKSQLDAHIATARTKAEALDTEQLAGLDQAMDLTFEEHFRFQQLQADAHATALLDTDAAQLVYIALGEVGSSKNGGWSAETDTATKVIVTQMMGELLARKIRAAR